MLGKLNASTIGLAAGQLEGAPLRFATELARVVDGGAVRVKVYRLTGEIAIPKISGRTNTCTSDGNKCVMK